MGNIVPRVGIEPTSLAFRTSVLNITSPRLPDVTTLPMPTCLPVYLPSLPERSVQTTTITTLKRSGYFLTFNGYNFRIGY